MVLNADDNARAVMVHPQHAPVESSGGMARAAREMRGIGNSKQSKRPASPFADSTVMAPRRFIMLTFPADDEMLENTIDRMAKDSQCTAG